MRATRIQARLVLHQAGLPRRRLAGRSGADRLALFDILGGPQQEVLGVEAALDRRAEITEIVRASEEMVRRWLKRYLAEGVEGLRDVRHPGAPRKVSAEYRELLVHAVRRRPRNLGVLFVGTLRCLATYLAERPGIRVEYEETVRVHLKAAGIVMSRLAPHHLIDGMRQSAHGT